MCATMCFVNKQCYQQLRTKYMRGLVGQEIDHHIYLKFQEMVCLAMKNYSVKCYKPKCFIQCQTETVVLPSAIYKPNDKCFIWCQAKIVVLSSGTYQTLLWRIVLLRAATCMVGLSMMVLSVLRTVILVELKRVTPHRASFLKEYLIFQC